MSRTCESCGRTLEPNQNFCGGCGAPVASERSTADPFVGQLVAGKFLIQEIIGTGAMGVVYKAEQVVLRKTVAVKILRRNLQVDRTVAKRFSLEARAASRLNHPNSVQILDFGELQDGALFMAMEYIQGRDLGKVIQSDTPLPLSRIVRIMGQVCSTLDEAHGAGIIHRDLKPANILISNLRSQKDFVKVLDFGIAKIIDPEPDASMPMTRDGFVCGTPAYMSPEQVQGLKLDARSDIFSLGIVLYQLLTGQLPFEADNAVEMATKIALEDHVAPSKIRPEWGIPAVMEEVVAKALCKDRKKRLQSALELKEALEEALAVVEAGGSGGLGGRRPDEAEITGDRVGSRDGVVFGKDRTPTEPESSVAMTQQTRMGSGPGVPASAQMLEKDRVAPGGAESQGGHQFHSDDTDPGLMVNRMKASWMSTLPVPLVLGGAALASAVVVLGLLFWFWPQRGEEVSPGGFVAVVLPEEDLDAASPVPGEADVDPVGEELAGAEENIQEESKRLAVPKGVPSGTVPGSSGRTRAPLPQTPPPSRPVQKETAVESAPPSPPDTPKEPKVQTPSPAVRARQLYEQASTLVGQGKSEEALKVLYQARNLDPGYAPIYRELGKIYMRRRDHENGLKYYRHYVKVAPDAPDATVYRTIISSQSSL